MAVNDYLMLIDKYARQAGVSPEIIRRMIEIESSFNPSAISPRGAVGLMQLLPSTARDVAGGDVDLFNPEKNIEIGTRYFKQLLDRAKGDERLAAAMYNAGMGNVEKYGGIPPFKETQDYINKLFPQSVDAPTAPSMTPGGQSVQNPVLPLAVDKLSSLAGGSATVPTVSGSVATIPAGAAVPEGMLGVGTAMDGSTMVINAPQAGLFDFAGIGGAGNAILPVAGVIGGADLLMNKRRGARGFAQGAASGAAIGSYFGPQGALIGAGIGLGVGALNTLFGDGKSKAQQSRDDTRKRLQSLGVIDSKYGITLADGSTFDMGKDGHAQLKGVDGAMRRYWETDDKNPLTKQAIGWANPLSYILGKAQGKDDVQSQQLASYLTNAITSNASDLETVRANSLGVMNKLGLNNDGAVNILKQMKDQGRLSQGDYDAAVYGLATMFSGNYEGRGKEKVAMPAIANQTSNPTYRPLSGIDPQKLKAQIAAQNKKNRENGWAQQGSPLSQVPPGLMGTLPTGLQPKADGLGNITLSNPSGGQAPKILIQPRQPISVLKAYGL